MNNVPELASGRHVNNSMPPSQLRLMNIIIGPPEPVYPLTYTQQGFISLLVGGDRRVGERRGSRLPPQRGQATSETLPVRKSAES